MKKITIVMLALVFCTGCAVTGQNKETLTKAEKEKWKTEAKRYKKNPAELKSLAESENRLSTETDSLESEVSNLQNQVAEEQKEKLLMTQNSNTGKRELLKYKEQLTQAESALGKYRNFDLNCPEKMVSGIVYRIQIGAYRKRDMSDQINNNVNFGVEMEGGMQKYTVGQFREKMEADKFRSQLVAMGLADAWIVTYEDGKRTSSTKNMN